MVKKSNHKREDRMELFSANELSRSKLYHYSTVHISYGICIHNIHVCYMHTRTYSSQFAIGSFILADAKQLAYETMFQDDEMLPPQSMPWWDPGYLANSDVSS